jgi:molecular chaperone DnaK (HSP70)
MADAKLSYNDLGDILMIGGSIRMPAVQDLVKTGLGPRDQPLGQPR